MNDLENPSAQMEDSNQEIESLHSQMNLLFGCMLVASLTLTAFLGLQARRAHLEAITLKGPATQTLQALQQTENGMKSTLMKLDEFGRTHPDFQKIIRFTTNAPAATAGPAKK